MNKLLFIALTIMSVSLNAQTKQKLTPELLFKLGRVNNPLLSPNGKQLLYEVKAL
jgi:Tol biopolymer transport system component